MQVTLYLTDISYAKVGAIGQQFMAQIQLDIGGVNDLWISAVGATKEEATTSALDKLQELQVEINKLLHQHNRCV